MNTTLRDHAATRDPRLSNAVRPMRPLLAVALVAMPLLARASADKPAAPVFYETTTVVGRPIESATGSVSVIDADEIAVSQARSAADLLRTVPGLSVLESGGRAGVTHAFLRGGDPNFTLVLLDGVPLNDATEMQGGAVNLGELSVELIDRAEIVRGPLCSFYGVSSLSGVVQLFTRRGAPGPMRAALGLEAGDASMRRGYGTIAGQTGPAGYAAGASWTEERHRVGQDSFRQFATHANTSLHLSPEAQLTLTGRYATGETDDYPDSSGGPTYGTGLLRHSRHDDVAFGARLELGHSKGGRHAFDLAFARRSRERASPAVPPIVPASEEDVIYSRLRLAWRTPLVAAARTTVDVGVSGDGEWADSASMLHLPPFLGGDTPGDYEKSRASGGVFAGLRRELGAVALETSLRVDAATTDALQVNPHLGLVWRLGRGDTRLRASGGRASKLASFTALASPKALGGNPDLRPERVLGGEVGIERTFRAARLDVGVALFRQEYRNLVDFDFGTFGYVNRSRVRTQGAEAHLRWAAHARLSVDADVTWLDAKDLLGGTLLHEPRWLGGARLTWQPAPQLSLRLDYRARARYHDTQYPVPERDSVAAHAALGCAGSWRVGRGLILRARLDNLADRAYETFIGFPGPRRSGWIGIGWERP